LLVHDRDPPDAASACLPKPEACFDPAVVGAKTERRGRAAPADAGPTHVAPTSAVIVGTRLGGSC
jgi:hypothetical protein